MDHSSGMHDVNNKTTAMARTTVTVMLPMTRKMPPMCTLVATILVTTTTTTQNNSDTNYDCTDNGKWALCCVHGAAATVSTT
jgi:hypothetical protein